MPLLEVFSSKSAGLSHCQGIAAKAPVVAASVEALTAAKTRLSEHQPLNKKDFEILENDHKRGLAHLLFLKKKCGPVVEKHLQQLQQLAGISPQAYSGKSNSARKPLGEKQSLKLAKKVTSCIDIQQKRHKRLASNQPDAAAKDQEIFAKQKCMQSVKQYANEFGPKFCNFGVKFPEGDKLADEGREDGFSEWSVAGFYGCRRLMALASFI